MAVATSWKESGGSESSESSLGDGLVAQENVVVKGGRDFNFIIFGSMLGRAEKRELYGLGRQESKESQLCYRGSTRGVRDCRGCVRFHTYNES